MPPPILSPYQVNIDRDTDAAWSHGHRAVVMVSATGSGKTTVFTKKMRDESCASIAVAHRQELVTQASVTLAKNEVRHRIVGAKKGSPLIRAASALHTFETGYSYIDPNAKAGVGGVDTLVKMDDPFFNEVRLGIIDEGHHVLRDNKWGRFCEKLKNARILLPTATPERADGKGLGRHADGIADTMVLAPGMRDIIDMGYLTDYKIFAPPSNLHRENIETSKTTGDFSPEAAKKAVHESTVTGDIVEHYLRIAKGKLGVTFAVGVEEAAITAEKFRAAGVPAEVVSGTTPDEMRRGILRRFANREILQLINVDLFGEGFDLPAIECVSFGRPSESLAVYIQQLGRALRLMIPRELRMQWHTFSDAQRITFIKSSVKPYGIVIDHVGNVHRHGLPDRARRWSLDRREARKKKKDPDELPVTTCIGCLMVYERTYKRCPYCDHYTPPAARSGPEYVDGDLTELDAETLAAMRKELEYVDGDAHPPQHLDWPIQVAIRNRHMDRQDAQSKLRNAIAWWAGYEASQDRTESQSYRRFYFRYGVDIAGARVLGKSEAEELTFKINMDLLKVGIDGRVSIDETYKANDTQ